MGGWASPGAEGHSSRPLPRPRPRDAAAPSHFPLGPLLAFQAAAFSIVNLETEKEAGGLGSPRGGNRSRRAARPSGVRCRVSPNPRPPRPGAPPTEAPRPRRPRPFPFAPPRAEPRGRGRRPRGRLGGREGAPAGKEAEALPGRSPQGPSPPGSPPSPLVSASPASPSEPKPFPRPLAREFFPAWPLCLQTATPGFTGTLDRETESQGGTVHMLRVRQPRLNS